MSKIALSGNPSGTGTFTIASPNSNTDRTLNLPDAAGTLALTSQIPAAPTVASTAEAQAGTNNTNFITPLRMREGFNASGSAPVYACRAWVNFDGTTTTPTIRASGNVLGVTIRATGRYTINLAAAISDVNYATVFGARNNADGQGDFICEDGAQSSQGGKATTSLDVMHANISGYADITSYYVAIFR